MSAVDEFQDRYKEIAAEADTIGRIITVGRLRVSQQIKIAEMTPNLDGDSEITDKATGNTISISRRMMPVVAASVRMIDGHPLPFPRHRGDLDARMDLLDEPGIAAAVRGLARLGAARKEVAAEGDEAPTGSAFDQAKK